MFENEFILLHHFILSLSEQRFANGSKRTGHLVNALRQRESLVIGTCKFNCWQSVMNRDIRYERERYMDHEYIYNPSGKTSSFVRMIIKLCMC